MSDTQITVTIGADSFDRLVTTLEAYVQGVDVRRVPVPVPEPPKEGG